MAWGRRKDNNQPYIKTGKKGQSGAGSSTEPVADVHLKSNEIRTGKREEPQIFYQNRNRDLLGINLEESDVEQFFEQELAITKRENPNKKIMIEKSIPIEEDLPEGKVKLNLISIEEVQKGGEILIFDQFFVFENKDKTFDIAST